MKGGDSVRAKPSSERDFDKYLTRIGATTRDRLKWAIRTVNAYRKAHGENWSPGDWDNVCLELAVFAGIGKALPGYGGIERKAGVIIHPLQNEAKGILESFQQMFDDMAQ